MTEDRRPQGTVQIALRISPDLRERVKAAAEANNRSVNSELTAALEEKYPPRDKYANIVAAAIEFLKKMPDEDGAGKRLRESLESMPVAEGWPFAMHFVRTALGEIQPTSDVDATAVELERLRKEYGPKDSRSPSDKP